GDMSWALWAPDADAGNRALLKRAGEDSFFSDAPVTSGAFDGDIPSADYSAELGGARRLAGLPPSVILTVGVPRDKTRVLEDAFSDCRLDTRGFDEIDPSACGSIIPSVIVVDATGQQGREFIMELRVDACGRYLPVVALTEDLGPPLGADEALDPQTDPADWVAPLRALMP
ncbi:MAG TPA: hypothetical protein VFO65_04240, partial [Acidimicrobiales bacterium]|nr:hypothetical protein [Acidimicrobiales bacterium]